MNAMAYCYKLHLNISNNLFSEVDIKWAAGSVTGIIYYLFTSHSYRHVPCLIFARTLSVLQAACPPSPANMVQVGR